VLEAAIGCLPPEGAESTTLTCDAQLPVVWADHDRMEQVFVNLLNNAFGHNPPGTRVRVTVTVPPGSAEVVIGVRDDGHGLPPELAAAPFEPARRARTGTGQRQSAGAGLGLSIAKGIVQAHGGRIELTPLDRGTCFSVVLPVEAEVLDPVRTTGPMAIRAADEPGGTQGEPA
jgi:signal transduction histidine kinase